jgi:hypothetical protein
MKSDAKTQGKHKGREPNGQFKKGHHPKTEWKPGESPNPNGRRNAISDILNEILEEEDGLIKRELARKLVTKAREANGNEFYMALDRVQDRTEGKARQTIDITEYKRPKYDGNDPEGYLSDRLSQRQGS